ncbi:cytosolic sulfotransferase 3-like [Dicentrarchus labrax]|uniref:cytosolic sulfotransferase 3-like n=1 Tax=Dicentrarchus labrax TaxID=13489 RepID=UPI0021F67F96|nr:cytosolic sulfotransferase 3-like [Dicentrarchus labrax]
MNVMEMPPRPTLFDFHGVSMIKYFTDNWDNVQNFKARPDDILIATYPKAGTTWVCYILDLLYFGQTCPERQASVPLHERVPFLEITIPSQPAGTDLADHLSTTPRLIKTHLPVRTAIIYVARNAKDNAVSYFHFNCMNYGQPEPGDWSTFLQNFMEGKMVFGSWYDHVNGWWQKKQTYSKLHYMFYEDLIEYIRLQRMNVKKGKVGDWKNHFTVAQKEEFDEDYRRKMKNPSLRFRTEV